MTTPAVQLANRSAVIAGVVAERMRAIDAARLVLLDDATPEATLAAELLAPRLGDRLVRRATAGTSVPEMLRAMADALEEEAASLIAHPANKTALLLSSAPFAAVYPLGDVWASEVQAWTGGWSGPPEVQRLSQRVGGIVALDAALIALVDRRESTDHALSSLGLDSAAEVQAMLARTRAQRRWPVLVPKLGFRTIGVDLLE